MLLSSLVAKAAAVGYALVVVVSAQQPLDLGVKNCRSWDGVPCAVDDPEACSRSLKTTIRCDGLWDLEGETPDIECEDDQCRDLYNSPIQLLKHNRRSLLGACSTSGYVCVGAQSIYCVRKCRTDWVWVRRCTGVGEARSCYSELVPVTTCWHEQSGPAVQCQFGEVPCQNGQCIDKSRACDPSNVLLNALPSVTMDDIRDLLRQDDSTNGTVVEFLDDDLGALPVVANSYAGQKAFLSLPTDRDSTNRLASQIAEAYGNVWSSLFQIGASPLYRQALQKFKHKTGEVSRRYFMLMFVPVCKIDAPNSNECYLNCRIFAELLYDFLGKCKAAGIEACDVNAFTIDCNGECTKYQIPGANLQKIAEKFDLQLAAPNATSEEYFNE